VVVVVVDVVVVVVLLVCLPVGDRRARYILNLRGCSLVKRAPSGEAGDGRSELSSCMLILLYVDGMK